MIHQVFPKSVVHGKPILENIPTGWIRVEFSEILNPIERKASLVDKNNYQQVTVKRNRGGVVLRQNITGEEIRTKTQFYIKTDDFLISRRQIVHGACGIVPPELDGSIVSNEYAVVHPSSKLSLGFLKYLCFTPYFQKTCFHASVGVHVEKMVFKIEQWLKYNIDIPPVYEQNLISDILEKWDSSISLTEKLIIAKNVQRKWLEQQLFSGETRSPEFVKSKTLQTTKYGELPQEWEYSKIQVIAKEISLKNKNGKALPVLSCTKHHGLVDSLKYFKKQIYSKDTSTYKIVKSNQFAYATNHIEEGSIGYQNLYDTSVISPMYTVFETNEKVDDNYLYLLLKTEKYRRIFQAHTSASVDRRGSLRWKDFSSLHIPLPGINEQKAIANTFTLLDTELALLNEQLEAFKQQKKGLMQQLLTGKIRVKSTKAA